MIENITHQDERPKENKFAPISTTSRIEVMDLLRGFALIGILFMNIEWFNRPISALLAFDYSQTGVDWSVSWLVKVFIEGKFYKLFSVLFGMGFAVMLIRAQQNNRHFGAWFSRRMLALFTLGMAHLIFLWGGDILHNYAVAGLLLLGFVFLLRTKKFEQHNKPETFAKVGFTLLLIPLFFSFIAGVFFGTTRDNSIVNAEWQQKISIHQQAKVLLAAESNIVPDEASQVNASESLNADGKMTNEDNEEEINLDDMSPDELIAYKVEQRVKEERESNEKQQKEIIAFTTMNYADATRYRAMHSLDALKITPFFAIFVCLPIFMIGYWLVASKKLENPYQNKGFFNVLCWGGLGIGLMINMAAVFIILHPAAKTAIELQSTGQTLFFYGQAILCAGYIGMFVKLSLKPWFIRFFSWLAPLGKMALTNYISHSIILTSVFYGYAGGMFGEIARGQQALIVIAIIFMQVVLSTLWLKAFRFGPLEWLWRSMTYLKIQPLLK